MVMQVDAHPASSDTAAMSDTGVAADSSETVEVSFHGVHYLLTVSTIQGDTLSIEVEQKSDASRWRGDFSARYIEDITGKTGNYKKFGVFVRMLLSALKQASDSVFIDLLTYQDLEVLKARKMGSAAQQAARPGAPNNKRYLILTYAAEFDRVHYPLPLLYDENPDPQHLKGIIASLRAELDALQSELGRGGTGRYVGSSGSREGGGAGAQGGVELRRLRDENTALRQQVRMLERAGAGRGGDGDTERMTAETREMTRELKMLRKDRDLLQARVEGLEAEVERDRGLHRRELRRKAKESQEVYEELSRSREQVRRLKEQVRQLESELASRRPLSASDRIRRTYGPGGGNTRTGGEGQYSRNNSRGASPSGRSSHSQYTSSGGHYARPPEPHRPSRVSGPVSSVPGSRPTSAPAARSPSTGRFDPTEYVRQQREALAARRASGGSASSSRAPTPPRSGRVSPAPSRGGVDRAGSRGLSPAHSRPSSYDGAVGGSTGVGVGSHSTRRTGSVERVVRPMSGGAAEPLYTRSRGASPGGGWSKFPTGGPGPAGGSRGPSRPQSAERATSPGRALQEVKRKLSEYVTKRSSDGLSTTGSFQGAESLSQAAAAPPPAVSTTVSKSQLFQDASADIADIDNRLHALQNFLRMAKATAPPSQTSQTTAAPSATT